MSLPTRILALCLTLLSFSGCVWVVDPGQAAMLYRPRRTPAFSKEILPPGRYRTWGRAKLVVYDVTAQNRDEVVHVLTADNLHVPVTVTMTYHPRKEELFRLHTQVGQDYYRKVLAPAFITLVRSEFSHHQHNDLAKESPEIEKIVFDKLGQIAEANAIVIDLVAIRHIDYDDTVTSAISRKIATRQQAEQKVYEVQIAEREADIARTAAQGRADSTRIQGMGDAAAIIARGTAQAEAQDKIGKTLTTSYLQYKAFDNHAASYFFVPTDKQGMPIIINAERPAAPAR